MKNIVTISIEASQTLEFALRAAINQLTSVANFTEERGIGALTTEGRAAIVDLTGILMRSIKARRSADNVPATNPVTPSA